MPKTSRETAAVEHHGPVTDRHAELDGYTVNIVSFDQDIDATPLLKGLPDDACSCPHWGYVLRGRVTFRFPESRRPRGLRGRRRVLPAGRPHPKRRRRDGVRAVQPYGGAEPRQRSHAAEHGGDAERVNHVGTAATNSSSGRRPWCIANRPAAARLRAPIFA